MINTKKGMIFFMRCFTEVLITFPTYITVVMRGIVPRPNKTIYRLLKKISVMESEANTAIYTKPHGKNPFRKPIVKNVSDVFFFKVCPSVVFTLAINLNVGFEKEYLFEYLDGMITITIIIQPINMEIYCCNPNK